MKPIVSTTELEELKLKVDTSPLKIGGANFKTNVLLEVSSSKLVYKPSHGVAIFCFSFLAVGLGVLFFSILPIIKGSTQIMGTQWFLILFGLLFTGAGVFMFYNFYKPRVFDKQLGFYYKSYKLDPNQKSKNNKNKPIRLKSIKAIQIIGEHVSNDKGSFKSFELNLVLEDGTRRNVVDHGNLKAIIGDAERLSEFLNIPIWH